MRAHNKAKKINQKLTTDSKLRSHEKAFRSNPWHYAKKVFADSSNTSCLNCPPSQAYSHFTESFKDDGDYCALTSWVSQVQHVPSEDDLLQFDLSPITPSIIKKVLRKHPSSSSPGDDGITYHHLKMMPSTHHFLASLFSKVLLCSHAPPTSWTHAKIIMIYKKGDTTDPANFRPIALTSVIGKLFHKILANGLERYIF